MTDQNSEATTIYETQGIKTLLGDPKKALWKLALPIIAANMFQAVYNLVDAFWVAGLGVDALASVGFFFPFFFIAISIGMGIGIGGGSAISRKIGAHDRERAGRVGTHTVIIMLLIAVVYTVPLLLFCGPVFVKMGAARILEQTLAYGRIMFGGTIFFFFSQVASSLLRSEGDTQRAMYAMALGSVINLVLDPVLIYWAGMGVAGAAWATIISIAVTSLLMFDWLFLKRNTYIPLHFKNFKFDKAILKDIFNVGIPASFQMIAMSLSMFLLNLIVAKVGGTDGIAVFSTGWRIITLGNMPAFGIAAAAVPLAGAAYGARNFEKLKTAYYYALRGGFLIEIPAVIILVIFAPQVTQVFTRSESGIRIVNDLIIFLRIVSLSLLTVAMGPVSSSVFQGIGEGLKSLIVTIIRTMILTPLLALGFAYLLNLKLDGIWLGIAMANIAGSLIAFLWLKTHIGRLQSAVL